MIELTPELAGTSLVASISMLFVAFLFQLYMLYLNWKQGKVKDLLPQLIEETKKTNQLLKKLVKKK